VSRERRVRFWLPCLSGFVAAALSAAAAASPEQTATVPAVQVEDPPSQPRWQLDEEVLENVAAIRARNPELREDAFSKMGGSSVESRAFLHCFAAPYVELGDYQRLAPTLARFNGEDQNSFDRHSDAAGVNWNLRYVLSGKPPKYRREIGETQARYALVLFGSNDAQNKNERVYLTRLIELIEELSAMGVVPVLGSSIPRRDASRDLWIRRFNQITEAVAEHWKLPYVDYYAAMRVLPRKGLARDGVHPNVLGGGGLQNACQFTQRGLRYGHNVRNLLTLQMLDALHESSEPSARADLTMPAEPAREQGGLADAAGTASLDLAGPPPPPSMKTRAGLVTEIRAEDFPWSERVFETQMQAGPPEPIPGCRPSSGERRFYRLRVRLSEGVPLRVSALALNGSKPLIHWIRHDEESGLRCVKQRTQTLELAAGPGVWDLLIEAEETEATDGQMLVLINRNR
jgi:hypothetical protein